MRRPRSSCPTCRRSARTRIRRSACTRDSPTRSNALNVRVGEFVAYWAVISVFAYYYEVIARFVFNSPTNWVHESMFLMYGMQYMLAGAYAYREDQHVRVDVFYIKFSPRGKAIADIVTRCSSSSSSARWCGPAGGSPSIAIQQSAKCRSPNGASSTGR